jgi:hypothetical protein
MVGKVGKGFCRVAALRATIPHCVKIFTPASLKQQSNKGEGDARAHISTKNFLIKKFSIRNFSIGNPSLYCFVALREKILQSRCVEIFTPASLKQQSNKGEGGASALISIKNFLIKYFSISNPSLCCFVALREKISQSRCVEILTPASLKQQSNKGEGDARALISIKNFLIKYFSIRNFSIGNPSLCCFVALREKISLCEAISN